MNFSIMVRINTKASAQIFTKFSGYSTRELKPIKKNAIFTQVPIKMDPSNAETHLVSTTVVDAVKVYSDQTGCFPVTTSR